MWSGGKKRCLGQRENCGSVVWWEKAMVGSKGKLWECGLTRKTAAWVKGKAVGVWSGGKKRWLGQRESPRSVVWWEKSPPGSKRKPPKCGLERKTAVWVKEEALGVWSGKGKLPPGSKKKSPECGLTRKNAAWVKEEALEVWSDKKNRRLGQRERHRSVVWWEKAPLGSKKLRPKKPDNKK